MSIISQLIVKGILNTAIRYVFNKERPSIKYLIHTNKSLSTLHLDFTDEKNSEVKIALFSVSCFCLLMIILCVTFTVDTASKRPSLQLKLDYHQ